MLHRGRGGGAITQDCDGALQHVKCQYARVKDARRWRGQIHHFRLGHGHGLWRKVRFFLQAEPPQRAPKAAGVSHDSPRA